MKTHLRNDREAQSPRDNPVRPGPGGRTRPRAARRSLPASRALPLPSAASGVALAVLLEETSGGWRAALGGRELTLRADPSVDPALLREALREGARVLLDLAGAPVIVGVVQTARALRIERDGEVRADVEAFTVRAAREALVQTGTAFLQIRGGDVELFGRKVLTRAREVAKVLARMIQLN